LTPDQIYERLGRRRAVWLDAIEEKPDSPASSTRFHPPQLRLSNFVTSGSFDGIGSP
jgi:hypothetical protein